jgi:hypothetical protein
MTSTGISRTLLPGLLSFVVCAGVTVVGALAGGSSHTGTTKMLNGSLDQCAAAITNAFDTGGYHGLLFIQSPVQWDPRAKVWSRIPATNEWSLSPGELPVNLIRKGNRMLPYDAAFEIIACPAGTNRCSVSVLTTAASIPGGKEPSIHGGGWVVSAKDIPPVLEEETNVLLRIEKQLISMQKGDPTPLPPTPDRWKVLHPGVADKPLSMEERATTNDVRLPQPVTRRAN